MIFISYLFLIFCFLKGLYYGIFEFKNQKNKKASILVFILSFIALILPSISLYISY